jgi:signal transduction histidine kinase
VFEPFYRGARRSPETPGFGLGLPFARAVARAHGGDIELASGRGDGTEFDLTLPLVDWSGHGG